MGEVIVWPRSRLQLSTQTELVSQEQIALRDSAIVIDHAGSEPNTQHTETAMDTENETQNGEDNLSVAAGANAENIDTLLFVLPDGTSLSDYPNAHILDPNDGDSGEPIVVEESTDERGAVQLDLQGNNTPFERNNIKGDPFHLMKMYKDTTKSRHGIAQTFSGLLRDAFFLVDLDVMEEKRDELANHLYGHPKSRFHLNREEAEREAKRRLYCPSSKILRDVPRKMPPPAVLEPRVQRVVDLCANVQDSRTGEIFFSKETWKVHNSVLKSIRLGYASDKPGVDYYYVTSTASGREIIWCVRGTSQLEGFHKHLRQIFPSYHTSSLLSTLLLALFVYRWNMDRAVERGLLSEEYGGWYDHELIHELQYLSKATAGDHQPDHADFINIFDYMDTKERFFTPIADSMSILMPEGNDVDVDLSPGMEFSAERDGGTFGLP